MNFGLEQRHIDFILQILHNNIPQKDAKFYIFGSRAKGNYKEYKTSINDFCCEYCLKNMLEILLSNPNISAVTTDYNADTCNTKKLNMTITYNLDNTNSQEILKLINNILD